MKKKYAIIAIGYNRPQSMQRLLKSLSEADYNEEKITLIISIDNSGTDSVYECAKEFHWEYGEKRIIAYKERQGLRKHILKCGDFLKEFDAVAVFEDDIVVAKGFFHFIKKTVEKYCDNDQIAGISLYKHLWNVNVNLPFEPANSPYDVYFMQFAQSWGQVWMRKQWFDFITWYQDNCEEISKDNKLPSFVEKWPNTSWLKYHIKYCVEKNKFFVYPYMALATCFSDVGEHTEQKNTFLQIPLLEGIKKQYCLPEFDDNDSVKYDVFFERKITYGKCIMWSYEDICFDLYGSKREYENKRYVITSRNLPYCSLYRFALEYRPHEANILNMEKGDVFSLYDTKMLENSTKRDNEVITFKFYFRLFGKDNELYKCVWCDLQNKIKRKIKRILG